MNKRKAHIRELMAMAMLLLFLAYYGNATLFYHAHIINGVIIVHSHVHNNHHHDSSDGEHSSSQITLISTLNSQLQFLKAHFGGRSELFFHLIGIIGQGCTAPIFKADVQYQSGRAPPFIG